MQLYIFYHGSSKLDPKIQREFVWIDWVKGQKKKKRKQDSVVIVALIIVNYAHLYSYTTLHSNTLESLNISLWLNTDMTQQDPEMAIIDALFAIVVGILINHSDSLEFIN